MKRRKWMPTLFAHMHCDWKVNIKNEVCYHSNSGCSCTCDVFISIKCRSFSEIQQSLDCCYQIYFPSLLVKTYFRHLSTHSLGGIPTLNDTGLRAGNEGYRLYLNI